MSDARRDITEVSNTDSQHDAASTKYFAVIKAEHETVRRLINTEDRLVFQLRHFLVPKRESIGTRKSPD